MSTRSGRQNQWHLRHVRQLLDRAGALAAAALIASTSLLTLMPAPAAAAIVTGTSTTDLWSGTGPGTAQTVRTGTGGLAEFHYGLSGPDGYNTQTWTFKSIANATGTLPLAWRLTGLHSWFQVRVGLDAYVKHGADSPVYLAPPLVSAGPTNCCAEPSDGFDYSGTTNLTVQAGDEIGFRITGSHYDASQILQGTLQVGLNVVANGGFEVPTVTNAATFDTITSPSTQLTGWSVSSGSIDHVAGEWEPAEGAQSIDLDGMAPGAIQQTVATVAGQRYRVAFEYSANGDRPSDSALPAMDVKADGSNLANGAFTHPYDAANPNIVWTSGEAFFTASESTTQLEFASADAAGPAGAFGIALDAVTVIPDLSTPLPQGFSFETPSAGANDDAPVALAQGTSLDVTVPVTFSGGATSVNVGVTSVYPVESGVSAITNGAATTASTVTISANAGADLGGAVVTINGVVGTSSDSLSIYVTVVPAEEVGTPFLTNAYHATGSSSTLYAGRLTAQPNTEYEITLASAGSCSAESFTDFGQPISVTTDDDGNRFFNGSTVGAPNGEDQFITAHVTGPEGVSSDYGPCVVNSPDNDTWPRALAIGSGTVPAGNWIDQPGMARWFKVPVAPGGSVTLDLSNVPADYDVYLFRDIEQTYAALTSVTDLTKLSAEFAGSGFSGSGFSGSGFSGSGFSGSGFSGSGFSGSGFSGSGFSPDSYSGSGFSGSGFSGSGFSGSGFSGSGFSGSGFSGSGFSADSFSAAQVYSLIAWSNNPGLAAEQAGSNTWTSTGDFYIRVNGKNGVSSLEHPFTLNVTVNSDLCTTVMTAINANPSLLVKPGPITNADETLILTDTSRFGGADTTGMVTKLTQLATARNGNAVPNGLINLNAPGRVRDLQALADANPGCVYAKNLVAQAAKDVVDAYRAGNTSGGVKYIVLAGGDNVLPFFRYPDTSSIGPEVNFFPPVQASSTSEASLRSNYTLGQDAYGSSTSIPHGAIDFPIPGLPVGRLVETPGEISGMVQAFLDQGVVTPGTSLVTGYDFIADAAGAIKTNLDAGTGETGASLVDPYGASPATGWTATALKNALLGRRNDITFLGGHFSASSALAADFATAFTTDDFIATTQNVKNTIIFSIGCHSGYNTIDADGIPNVTRTLDWPQAFARKQVTAVVGTGYQYGDTDFIEYSERIYNEFSKQLRYGNGPIGIGNALVASKLAYLKETPAIGDLHEKALLESVLYGLPMLGVDMPAGRIPAPTGVSTLPLNSFAEDVEPAASTGLRFADVDQTTASVQTPKTLNVQGGGTLSAKYYTGSSGVLTTPGAPVLPLYARGVKAADAGYVLRGIGFTGGSYVDSTVTPLTGAPGTELQSAHTSFNSPTFYPTAMWTANYFDALAGGGTTLFMTPAQHRAPTPGSDTVTLRLYDNLKLRLFYSNSLADGAKSAPPAIYGITSDFLNPGTQISAHVVGDPKADVQTVWVTYTEPGSGEWKSFDLARDGTDPSLWTGLQTLAPNTKFMVQAVNGFGVVSRNDNSAAYYTAGVAPAPVGLGSIDLSGATSGAYGANASITATLKSNGITVSSGKLVVLTLGSVTRSGTTNASGQVNVSMPLSAGAGTYPLTATFAGDSDTGPASTSALFSIGAAPSTVTITCPTRTTYTGAPITPCTARATGVGGLDQLLPVIYTANTAVGTATAVAQFYGDAAHAPSSATKQFAIWQFTGFQQPVDNLPLWNSASAGQAIPIKFSLGANRGLNIFLTNNAAKIVKIACPNASTVVDAIETYSTSTSGLQFDAGSNTYTYVWKTAKSLAGGCYQFQLNVFDGPTDPVANFKFK